MVGKIGRGDLFAVGLIMVAAVVFGFTVVMGSDNLQSSPVCGEGDLPPCLPGQTSRMYTIAGNFTPTGCALSGGIVSCTQATANHSPAATADTGILVSLVTAAIGVALLVISRLKL